MTKKFLGKIAAWSAMSPWVEFAALARKSNLLAHENKTFTLGLSYEFVPCVAFAR